MHYKNESQSIAEQYGNQRQAALIYLAGIIDGEGCLRISMNTEKGQYCYAIAVGMVNRSVIELLQTTFGGRIHEERVPNRRSIWRWVIQKQDILVPCLKELIPYLVVKKPQAELILEAIETRDSKLGRKITEEELQRREQFYLRMKKLNAVGAAATTNRENT